MDKVKELRAHAVECRRLANGSRPELREHYENLARVWDRLANERLTFFGPDENVVGQTHRGRGI